MLNSDNASFLAFRIRVSQADTENVSVSGFCSVWIHSIFFLKNNVGISPLKKDITGILYACMQERD